MSRNGSGTYSLPAGNPVVTGTTISSTWANNTLSDIATALTASIANDGQTVPTANLPMGGFKHTGVATASATTDYARADQVQSSSFQHLTGTAGTNTITASATPTPSAYAAGQRFTLIPANTNTGATTLDVSSLGAKNVFWNGVACVGGEIRQNVPILVFYDGTQFHLLGNSFNAPFNDAYPVVEGSADSTKKVRFEVDGLTTATTRTLTVPDASDTLALVALAQTLTNKTLTSPVLNTGVSGTALADAAATLTGSSTSTMMTPGGFAGNKSLGTTSGYYKFPGGFMVQWVNNVTCNTGATTDVNWPVSFPTACVAASAMANAASVALGITTLNTTKASVGNTSGSNVTPYVIGIGY